MRFSGNLAVAVFSTLCSVSIASIPLITAEPSTTSVSCFTYTSTIDIHCPVIPDCHPSETVTKTTTIPCPNPDCPATATHVRLGSCNQTCPMYVTESTTVTQSDCPKITPYV
ncbi:hypothetical protein V8E54_000998 [Elaphomyces granulatus]